MGRALVLAGLCAAVIGGPNVAQAQVLLQNDGFVTGSAAGFQAGFVSGEMAAVVLVPDGAGPHQITAVRLLFGGQTSTETITLRIYADTGAADPGAELFSGDFQLMGSDSAMHEINLISESVFVSGPFRVAIQFQHSGLPAIARDDDGTINASRNFILAQGIGWVQSNLLGLTGDWVIRAMVASGDAVADAGVVDAGVVDAAVVDGAVAVADASPAPDAATPEPDGGLMCELNSDCPNGNYCGNEGTCTFDCRTNTDCDPGMECDPVGRCVDVNRGGDDGCGCSQTGGEMGGTLALLLLASAIALRRRERNRAA